VNADEAPIAWWWNDWDAFYDAGSVYGVSDHDPVLIGLSLNPGKAKGGKKAR